MTFQGYTKRDTNTLKGVAILCIVFHNYFHWLWPSPGENEFDFAPDRIRHFFDLLGQQPSEFVNILFSYFGHYGVQIFLFISGFGLAVSMMQRPRSWESFVVHRLKKLYPLLLTAILAYILVLLVTEHRMLGAYEKQELGYKLLFLHTLIPDSGLSVNGPWWFFGLIFYLYLLFPWLYRWIQQWGYKAFFIICIVSYTTIFLFRHGLTLYHGSVVMMNPPGHLPEFCLGILLACSQGKRLHPAWFFLALVVFCLGNCYALFYPFTFLAVTVLVVYASQKRLAVKAERLALSGEKKAVTSHLSPLAYFGSISLALFAVHGFLRTPVLKWANTLSGGWAHLGSALLYFLVSWGVAIAAKALYDRMVSLLDKITLRESKATRILGGIFQVALLAFFVFVISYYLVQEMKTDDTPVGSLQVKTADQTFASDTEFLGLASASFNQNTCSFSLQGSFGYRSLDTVAPLPVLVVDIPNVLWREFPLAEHCRSGRHEKFEFSFRYLCPFVKNLRNKPIKIYLWNRNQSTAVIDQLEFKLLQ